MRKAFAVLVCLLIALGSVAADEKKPAKEPPKPLTPEQSADAVQAAVKAKDDKALKALAEKDKPDPWLVADELLRRGKQDAAGAFARAVLRREPHASMFYEQPTVLDARLREAAQWR